MPKSLLDDIISGIENLSLDSPPLDKSADPSSGPKHSPEKANVHTQRLLAHLNIVDERVKSLTKALEELAITPSHEQYEVMHATLCQLRNTMERNPQTSESIQTARRGLLERIRDLIHRLKSMRPLPDKDGTKKYPIGTLFISCLPMNIVRSYPQTITSIALL